MSRIRSLLLATTSLCLAASAAHAQQPRFGMTRTGTPTTSVTVNFSFPVTLPENDVEKQQEAMERVRRRLYEIADRECKLLLATIASTCRLERVNVNSNVNRRPVDGGWQAQMGAHATYRIELKTEI